MAIIGAGIAGLACAHDLTRAGHNVTIFEKEDHPGGRMWTDRSGYLPFDRGADFFIDGWYSELQSLARELNVPWALVDQTSSHRVMRGGTPRYIVTGKPSGFFSFDALNLLSHRSRISFLFLILRIRWSHAKLNFFDLSANPAKLDHLSASEYLEHHATKELVDYVADPFTSIMQFHRADEIGASALFSFLSEIMRMGSKFRVAYTPGGIGSITDALAGKLNIKYNQNISSIRDLNDEHDAVVVATTAPAAQCILSDESPNYADYLANVAYASTIVASFKIPANLFPDRALFTYVPFVENTTISGYDNTIQKDENAQRESISLMNVYLHETAAGELSRLEEAEQFAVILRELAAVCPEVANNMGKVEPHKLRFWKEAMPKFTGKHIAATREFLKNEQGKNNIYFAGDYLNAPWVEGALRSGKRVASLITETSHE